MPFVAASDASDRDKRRADYVCDGIEDNVQIQAAIDELPGGGLCMLRDKFEGQDWFSQALAYWMSAFPPIAERLEEASRWVAFHPDLSGTWSTNLSGILKDAGSAFDSALRALVKGANVPPRRRRKEHDISDFCDFLRREVPDIHRRSVTIRHCLPVGVVFPFNDLAGQDAVPGWWTAYNKVKHEESVRQEEGNLQNAVMAVCALALLGMLMGGPTPKFFVNVGVAYRDDSVDMSDKGRLFRRKA